MDQQKETKKKGGFLGGLLRSRSLAINRGSKVDATDSGQRLRDDLADSPKGKKQTRRVSAGDGAARRSRPAPGDDHIRSRRRPRRPEPEPEPEPEPGAGSGSAARRARSWKGKGAADEEPDDRLVTEWPPQGLSSDEELPPQHAQELICRGAPAHKGHKRAVPHASDHYYALYATTSGGRGEGSDAASLHDSMTQLMTMRTQGRGQATHPWETLEQPSCAFLYGQRPGTITLNHWASMASVLPPTIALRDSGVAPRDMDLARILERLEELQAGLEDDDEGLLYKILYRRILRDPDRILSPHKTLDRQITDLILVLSRPDWIDFTDPKNQVVTRFIFDRGEANAEQYRRFLHQLLLSLELELRIHSPQHRDWAKEKLLQQMPPTMRWNLALARRWRDNVRVDEYGASPEQSTCPRGPLRLGRSAKLTGSAARLRYKLKKRQVKTLKRFAQTMKWPNLGETLDSLRQKDDEFRLDAVSSDAFAFFSGLVLPGPTLPFLTMNALIDLDPDPATDELALLSHTNPHCGFQYRNSHTYWSASCIVGKVLAPTCRSVAGWVGPGRPTADLGRSQIARIRSRRPRQQQQGRRMGPEDVESMGERSDPLGPPAEAFPVGEYALAQPQMDGFVVDTVRIELLGFRPVAVAVADETGRPGGPKLFDATVQFAIDGLSWPLRLMYDVSFISAWPCSDGPHPLFFDYVYKAVRVDELVRVRDWGGLYYRQAGGSLSSRSSPAPPPPPPNGTAADVDDDGEDEEEHDDEKVLVVEAFGVRDNEALARAWCSHWGLSAVVADIHRTCMACAIREAYAATLTVVILVDDQLYDDEEHE
ncbi:Uncharacterized protein TPAR_08661 [Tolypocladium paradoxum]|uniref:Uncharacterized protein n=1 Tax=Tolypocladium paradoxum TaxID=94208 RepID=A0A2S4KLQ1_9HYPO|nr:Uncharacterized protein TPAR_08661 [Tolypocladium paradoxum]